MRIMRLGRVCCCVAVVDASWRLPSKMRRLLYGLCLVLRLSVLVLLLRWF